MSRSLAIALSSLVLVGCTPSPEKVCANLSALAEQEATLDNKQLIRLSKTCLYDMTDEMRARPEFYKCHAKCVMRATKLADADACETECTVASRKGPGSTVRKRAVVDATRALSTIEKRSKDVYQQETDTSDAGIGPFVHAFCPSTSRPVPADVPKGTKVAVPLGDWSGATWTCLKFSVTEPQPCQYDYKSSGIGLNATFTATAKCDPDGDGKLLTIVLTGKGSETGDAQRVSLHVEGE